MLLGTMVMPKPLSAGIARLFPVGDADRLSRRWHASRYVRFGKSLHNFARESRANGAAICSTALS